MTDRTIIFSPPMVRAVLAGRKSQTRRIIKPQPEMQKNGRWHLRGCGGGLLNVAQQDIGDHLPDYVRWREGDRLWVREPHKRNPHAWAYEADLAEVPWPAKTHMQARARDQAPAMFLPRIASRLTLEVTGVRVQRLQEISEEDAEAEGCEYDIWDQALAVRNYGREDGWYCMWGGPKSYTHPDVYRDEDEIWRASFQSLWNSLHGPDAWSANPWVCALTFTVTHANIDATRDPEPPARTGRIGVGCPTSAGGVR